MSVNHHILITGGAGFVGSNLSNHLISEGFKVRVLDNLSPQIHGKNPKNSSLYASLNPEIEFIHGSVTKKKDLLIALKNIDTVVHLAAETGTGQSMYEIEHYTNINVHGTALLLDLIANNTAPSVKKIILASSRAVYGEGKYKCDQHGFIYPKMRLQETMKLGNFDIHCPFCKKIAKTVGTDEESLTNPNSIYGITKLTQEQMVHNVAKALDISAVALRFQNIYGPGQSLSNPYTGILSIFSNRIKNNNPINIFEDGNESRDFVYIDDVVIATTQAIKLNGPIVDILNVGSGIATNVKTIVNLLQKEFCMEVKTLISGQFRIGDIRHNFADISKAKKLLNFQPKTDIKKGLRNFVKWVEKQKIGKDYYDQSLNEMKKRGLFK